MVVVVVTARAVVGVLAALVVAVLVVMTRAGVDILFDVDIFVTPGIALDGCESTGVVAAWRRSSEPISIAAGPLPKPEDQTSAKIPIIPFLSFHCP